MEKLNFEEMASCEGGGCIGSVAGSLAVTIAGTGIAFATGPAFGWALAAWVVSKAAITVTMIEDCVAMAES